MFKIRVELVLNKSVEDVFTAITDHGNYKQFPGISDSRLIERGIQEPNGKGALREVIAGPFKLTERITGYQAPSLMTYKIEKTSPIAMRHDKGEITMQSLGKTTRVIWISEGHMKVPVVGNAMDKLIEFQVTRTFRNILKHIGNA